MKTLKIRWEDWIEEVNDPGLIRDARKEGICVIYEGERIHVSQSNYFRRDEYGVWVTCKPEEAELFIRLSGFGKLDRTPYERKELTVAQRKAIRKKERDMAWE